MANIWDSRADPGELMLRVSVPSGLLQRVVSLLHAAFPRFDLRYDGTPGPVTLLGDGQRPW